MPLGSTCHSRLHMALSVAGQALGDAFKLGAANERALPNDADCIQTMSAPPSGVFGHVRLRTYQDERGPREPALEKREISRGIEASAAPRRRPSPAADVCIDRQSRRRVPRCFWMLGRMDEGVGASPSRDASPLVIEKGENARLPRIREMPSLRRESWRPPPVVGHG